MRLQSAEMAKVKEFIYMWTAMQSNEEFVREVEKRSNQYSLPYKFPLTHYKFMIITT